MKNTLIKSETDYNVALRYIEVNSKQWLSPSNKNEYICNTTHHSVGKSEGNKQMKA